MTAHMKHLPIDSPEDAGVKSFTDAAEAVAYLQTLYNDATHFLRTRFSSVVLAAEAPTVRYRKNKKENKKKRKKNIKQ